MLAWLEETHLTQDSASQPDSRYGLTATVETILGGLTQMVVQFLQAAVFRPCSHPNIQPVEGKSHCPDCGTGVVASWIILKCSGCDKRRDARLCFGQLWPEEKHCRDCGAQETYCHYLNPRLGVAYPYAWLVWESESLYLERLAGGNHQSLFESQNISIHNLSSHNLSSRNKIISHTPCQVWVEASAPNKKEVFGSSVAPQGAAPNPFCLAMP